MRNRILLAILLAAPLAPPLGLAPRPAHAQEADDPRRDQINLVWVAGYQGPLSGRMGPKAREAVARFQDAIGSPRTGVLSDEDRDELERRAVAEKRRLGWQMRIDAPTGMRIGIPEAQLGGVTRRGSGTEYKGVRNGFFLQTMVFEAAGPEALRENMGNALDSLRAKGFTSRYMTAKDNWFVVNAGNDAKGIDAYVRMHRVGGWVKGYFLFTPQSGGSLGAMVPAISLSLEPGAEEPLYRPPAEPPVARQVPPPPPAAAPPAETVAAKPAAPSGGKSATGSGFVVAPGRLLTNYHVIEGCGAVTIAGGGPAKVVARDEKNDLALLDAPSAQGRVLTWGQEATRLGEDVVAMGFPLGSLLGNRLNITQGIVSSTEGFQGDFTNLQIAVPVQPGNSGGPLLDFEGRVSGVVVAKLKSQLLASGEILVPEQVNFAIKGEVAKGFLKGNGIVPLEAPSLGKDGRKSTADIAEATRASVVQVVCK